MTDLTFLDYAVYGVLAAAKRETGPGGARRVYRIMMRLDRWDQPAIEAAVLRLIGLGWVRQCEPVLGMVHFELAPPAEEAEARG